MVGDMLWTFLEILNITSTFPCYLNLQIDMSTYFQYRLVSVPLAVAIRFHHFAIFLFCDFFSPDIAIYFLKVIDDNLVEYSQFSGGRQSFRA